jgi:hypothetical protein
MISPRIVQRLRITSQKIIEILLTFLFDGTRVADIIYRTEEIQIKIDRYIYNIDFDIFSTINRDIILGIL